MAEHNCNPSCTNIHCEGGIITFDGATGRLCRKCNPVKKVKKLKIGSYVYVEDESECNKRFSSYPKSRVFVVSESNHNYVWLDSMSMGIEHKYVKLATEQQISNHLVSLTKYDKRRTEAIRISKEKVTVTFTGELTVQQAINLLKIK